MRFKVTEEEKQSRIDYVNQSYPNGLKKVSLVMATADTGRVLLKTVLDKDGKCIDLAEYNWE